MPRGISVIFQSNFACALTWHLSQNTKRAYLRLISKYLLEHMIARKPSDRWPEERYEDLFQCFKCKEWKPAWWYSFGLHGSEDTDANPAVLEAWKANGHIWACDHCFQRSELFACVEDGNKINAMEKK